MFFKNLKFKLSEFQKITCWNQKSEPAHKQKCPAIFGISAISSGQIPNRTATLHCPLFPIGGFIGNKQKKTIARLIDKSKSDSASV